METINLSNYDSSQDFKAMDEGIEHGLENVLNIETLSRYVNVKDEIICPDLNVLEIYKNFLLDNYCVWLELPEQFYCKPDYIANEIYGTVDLWYLVLWTAQVPSAMELTTSPIRVFDPRHLRVLNDIINRHFDEFQLAKRDPNYIEDMTLKKVKIKDTRFI